MKTEKERMKKKTRVSERELRYLDATRESVELRSRPRDPFSTVLSSSSSCIMLVQYWTSSLLSRFARVPIYSRFFVVFAYGGRVITVLYALLDPPSSFLPAKANHLHLHHSNCRFLVSFSSLFSFILRSFLSCQAQSLSEIPFFTDL